MQANPPLQARLHPLLTQHGFTYEANTVATIEGCTVHVDHYYYSATLDVQVLWQNTYEVSGLTRCVKDANSNLRSPQQDTYTATTNTIQAYRMSTPEQVHGLHGATAEGVEVYFKRGLHSVGGGVLQE